MSTKFPGGIISKTAPTPSGPYADSTAPGIWTLEQQAYWQKLGQWPTAGNVNPSAFIGNLFSTYLYTGTGANQVITNNIDLSTYGGLVWAKNRGTATSNVLIDTSRGGTEILQSNTTDGNVTVSPAYLTAQTTGYQTGPADSSWNGSGQRMVSWTFREQPKFFDVVTYTGNSTARTIAHNLGSVPGCIIIKGTTGPASTQNWAVYHRSTGNTQALFLDLTQAPDVATNYWNDTTPTSTVFSLGAGASVNNNTTTYVAYLFAHDAGGFGLTGTDNVISCGSWTNNGSGNASVTLGYEPQWILWKRSDSTSDWYIFDTMRGWTGDPANTSAGLRPNLSNAENSLSGYAINSTGFSVAGVASASYIYIAIRRGPMKVPTSGTSVFKPILTGSGTTLSDSYSAIGFPIDMTLRYQTGTDTSGSYKNAVYTRLMGINSSTGATPTDGNNPNLLTHSTAAQDTTYYYSQTGSMGIDYGGSWNAPAYVLTHLHFKRAPSFFDVVCYTGNNVSGRTITHNLAAVPELMIVKSRTSATRDWMVYDATNGATNAMNLNNDSVTSSSSVWVSTAPTSTVFTVSDSSSVNDPAQNYVAYLFATCAGVSKVGSYTGTATTKQIDCGFTAGARFVLIKRTDSTGDWYVWDSARGIIPANDPYLLLNSTAAEVTGTDYVDTYSAGFEISSTAPAAINASGGTFIFLAIA
jgi:hypothetical protein